MKSITVNNHKVAFTDEKNLLAVIRKAGIEIPTFCYHSDLSTYGACRMCVVEDDRGRIMASCSEKPRDGMVIYTNTKKLQHHRKMILELLLASHDRECTKCRKSQNCQLQKLSYQLGVNEVRFDNYKERRPLDTSSQSIVIDPNKCILCGDCIRTCEELQGVGAIDFAFRGSEMRVSPAFGKSIAETDCVGCGQCRVVCPTGAITVRTNVHDVWEAIQDPNTRVVAQIAPAVRVAIGDKFGLPKGTNSLGKMVAAMRRLGFDAIYDTNVGADLTIMEETAEFMQKLESGEGLPLFTSCCPGWVKFCENRYPEFRQNISTCRSPMQMFGAVLKEEKRLSEDDGKKLVVVAIMPCTAKKGEINRPEHVTEGQKDVDWVLTTTELYRMIREGGMDLNDLQEEALDMPFGIASGAGAIFGVTGGVTEAVLRRVVNDNSPAALEDIAFTGIRGNKGIKEATVNVGGRDVRIAVVNGLKNADILLKEMKEGTVKYDFVEVMACSRGCIAGGGQPLPSTRGTRDARIKGMYGIDAVSQIKLSNENPIVHDLYDGILKGKEHKLLHNHYPAN